MSLPIVALARVGGPENLPGYPPCSPLHAGQYSKVR